MATRPLLLASGSPRRRLLLDEMGFDHQVIPSGVDDAQLRNPGVSPITWTVALAYLKARAGRARLSPRDAASSPVILGADTVVVAGDRILGQPRSEAEAVSMITALENGPHDVITGVAILHDDTRTLFADASIVTVGNIGRQRIDSYVATGSWRGKAGGYNLSERIDAGWPIQYSGDPTTVMGLPMNRLAPILEQLLAPRATHARK